MERSIWENKKFSEDFKIKWSCPTCGKGRLIVVKDKFYYEETALSRSRSGDDWEPEFITHNFTCVFKCSNPDCGDIITACGYGDVSDGSYYDEGQKEFIQEFTNDFEPKYVNPPFKIIDVSPDCPLEITKQLQNSFSLFWSDVSACANSIRKTVELIMDDKGMKKTEINRSRKRVPIALHKRIIEFRDSPGMKKLGESFLAVKWIGNPGSHGGEGISDSDLLDAYEILELALHELYDTKKNKIEKIVKAINKTKKPRSKVKRKF